MPEIIVAAAASSAGGFVAGTVFGLTAGTIAYGVVAGLTAAVVSYGLSSALGLNRAPESPQFTSSATGRQQLIRSPVATRRVVYGQTVNSGPLVYAAVSGSSNEYLHLVIPVNHGESQAVSAIWYGDEQVGTLDVDGNVTDGSFADYMRVKIHLGADDQVADSDLVSEVDDWTTDHRLRGITYIYLRLKYSTEVFPYGLQNIKALVAGRKLYDPRSSTTAWSDNWALVMRDYLMADFGLRALSSEIDSSTLTAAANVCDEGVATDDESRTVTIDYADGADGNMVTSTSGDFPADVLTQGCPVIFSTTGTPPAPLTNGGSYWTSLYQRGNYPTKTRLSVSKHDAYATNYIDFTTAGTGTHTLTLADELRYTCNGTIDLGETPASIIKGLLTAANGTLLFSEGKYWVYPAVYATPTVSLNESDLRGDLVIQTRPQRQDLFNAVRGVYVSPHNYWQPTDFPPVTNATYETQDGSEQIVRDIELPFTISPWAAQRLAKIILERSRQGITCMAPCKLTAFKLRAWDTVQLSISQFGWVNKVFRIIHWTLQPDGGVDLEMQEEASASYSWSDGEATILDPAPDTVLPQPGIVAPPSNLSVDYSNTILPDGTISTILDLEWDAAPEPFIKNYEIEWKVSTSSDYARKTTADKTSTAIEIPVSAGVEYDVRIRTINSFDAASEWIALINNYAYEKTTAPGICTSLVAIAGPEFIRIEWINPSDFDLHHIDVYRADSDDRDSAGRVAQVLSDKFIDSGLNGGAQFWYWVRAVDTTGNQSDWNASSGVSSTAQSTLQQRLTNQCESGDTVVLSGVWAAPPSILVSPASVKTYDENYSAQSQTLVCEARNIIEVTPGSGEYQFDAIAELVLDEGTELEQIDETYSGSTNTWTSDEYTSPSDSDEILVKVIVQSIRGNGSSQWYHRSIKWRVEYLDGSTWTNGSWNIVNMGEQFDPVESELAFEFPSSDTWTFRIGFEAYDTDTVVWGTIEYEYDYVSSYGASHNQESGGYTYVSMSDSLPSGWTVVSGEVTFTAYVDCPVYGVSARISFGANSKLWTYPTDTGGYVDYSFTYTGTAWQTSYKVTLTSADDYGWCRCGGLTCTYTLRRPIVNSTTPDNDFELDRVTHTLTGSTSLATGVLNYLAIGS